MLLTLRAVHSSRHVFGAQAEYMDAMEGRLGNAEAATQDAVHPVVIRHPLSGRPSLYVNPGFTLRFDGWTDKESAPLLDFLYRTSDAPSTAFGTNGVKARWHFGTTGQRGTGRSTTIKAAAERCRVTIEGVELGAA